MGSKPKKGTKDKPGSQEKDNSKDDPKMDQLVANDTQSPPQGPEVPQPFVNPLPLVKHLEDVIKPLEEGENQFVSIVNGAPENVFVEPLRIQRTEIILDDPYKPPSPVLHYGGSSYDCYLREELDHLHDLCESCKEIWRRWPIRPPPPLDIDPYENFLYVGDLDPYFQPAPGDIVIFHPFGPQCEAGLRTGWGFVSSYKGPGDLKFHPNDLVVRLGSFSNSNDVVDYIPYDKVEVRALTTGRQWRFLGGQVGLVQTKIVGPLLPIQPLATPDQKSNKKDKGKEGKNKKKTGEDGKKDSKSNEMEKDNKKDGKKEKKKQKKVGEINKLKEGDGKGNDMQMSVPPQFTMDGIPDVFNTIPKVPNTFQPHLGEEIFKTRHLSLTCNYRYNKPGFPCGMGEIIPQVGDIIIREPQAWMHDDWGDKKKRLKGSMAIWHNPRAWKWELMKGVILLRPHIDRDMRLEIIPQCPYTPLMWSQWGNVELYVYEGRLVPKLEPAIPTIDAIPPRAMEDANNKTGSTNKKAGAKSVEKMDKSSDKKNKANDNTGPENTQKKEDKKAQKEKKDKQNKEKKDTKDDQKARKDSTKSLVKPEEGVEINDMEKKVETKDDDMLWSYWGRSAHIFDRPFQVGALDTFCSERHQAEMQKVVHLDFFVEDCGVEIDAKEPLAIENLAISSEEPKSKKVKGKTEKEIKEKRKKENETEKEKKKK